MAASSRGPSNRTAGEAAATKFLEFFAARIRSPNTREAYARASGQFLPCSEHRVDYLRLIGATHVAAYIEKHPRSPHTIKLYLAASKMLFDYLVNYQESRRWLRFHDKAVRSTRCPPTPRSRKLSMST